MEWNVTNEANALTFIYAEYSKCDLSFLLEEKHIWSLDPKHRNCILSLRITKNKNKREFNRSV